MLLALLFTGIGMAGCEQRPKTPEHLKETVDKTSKEYASAYICPMHCEGSGSHEPGKCPVCKMDYVKNKDYREPEIVPEAAAVDSVEGTD